MRWFRLPVCMGEALGSTPKDLSKFMLSLTFTAEYFPIKGIIMRDS